MRYFRAYLPVILWMALIFFVSTDFGASHRTSRIIGPILKWFNPDVSEETIRSFQLVIRKCAHLAEYAVLAGLMWVARRKVKGSYREWDWREAWMFILPIACLYAISDEMHQGFVSSRQGSPWDVLIDATGAFLGLLAIWIVGRLRKIW